MNDFLTLFALLIVRLSRPLYSRLRSTLDRNRLTLRSDRGKTVERFDRGAHSRATGPDDQNITIDRLVRSIESVDRFFR